MTVRTESYLSLYHGTDSKSAESILQNGFLPSRPENNWCGAGVYFYDVKAKAWWSASRTCKYIKAQKGQTVKPEVLKADVQNVNRKDILDLRAPDDVRGFKEFADALLQGMEYETSELDDEERIIKMRSMLIDYYATESNKKMIVGIFKQRERDDMGDIIDFAKGMYFILGVETIYCVRDVSLISNVRRCSES